MNSNEKKILVAVDGSNQSLEAVRYAGRLPPAHRIDMVLFHVLCRIPEFFYDLGEEPQLRQGVATIMGFEMALSELINKFMDEARQVLIDRGISPDAVTIDIRERELGIARDIIRESTRGYSAVVVGRNGLNKINGFVLGSVVSKLLETLIDVSICVVGGKPKPEKIILAMDESEDAMRAVDYVGTMLGGLSSEVTLLHVVRGYDVFERRFGHIVDLMREEEWLKSQEMEPIFEEARARLVRAGLDQRRLSTKVITGVSSRAGAITEEASNGGYGTIVVGRRGLSKVYEFSMGRVGNKVIQMAKDQAVWVVS